MLHEYFKWAMRITCFDKCAEYQEISSYLKDMQSIKLVSLGHYIGWD